MTTERTCPSCGGNDQDAPCAYPSEGMPGCLRVVAPPYIAEIAELKAENEQLRAALRFWLPPAVPDPEYQAAWDKHFPMAWPDDT